MFVIVMKERLYSILMNDDVVSSIRDNMLELCLIIPEVKDMFSFAHNHPHHHLDVWEHTLLALSRAPMDFDVRLTLLLHDIGKPHSYQDDEVRHFHGHADVSSTMSEVILSRLGYEEEYIMRISYLIKEHDTPMTEEEIIKNRELMLKRYYVQYCDALAHNPTKLEKRIKYLKSIQEIFGEDVKKLTYSCK